MRSGPLFLLIPLMVVATACGGDVPINTAVTIASIPNQSYVFYDVNGTQIAVQQSTTDGAPIVQEIEPGASVTSFATVGAIHLQTVMDLVPGESIEIELPSVSNPHARSVRLPAAMISRAVEVKCWCNGVAETVFPAQGESIIEVSTGCGRPTVLATTVDDDLAPLSVYQRDMLPDASGVFDLSATAMVTTKNVGVEVSGIPSDLSFGAVALQSFDRDHEVDFDIGGTELSSEKRRVIHGNVLDVGGDLLIAGYVQQRRTESFQYLAVVQKQAPYAIDISSALLPWVANPVFENGTNSIKWTSSAVAGVRPRLADGVSINLKFTSQDGRELSWEMLAPFNGNQVTVPPLPAWTPIVVGSTPVVNSLKLISITGGYAALRTVPLDAIGALLANGGALTISTPSE